MQKTASEEPPGELVAGGPLCPGWEEASGEGGLRAGPGRGSVSPGAVIPRRYPEG